MAVMKAEKPHTIEDLLKTPEDGRKYELVDGEIVVSPGGFGHSRVGTRIITVIAAFLDQQPVAEVLGADLGVILPNGDLRSPDVTLVRKDKVPVGDAAMGFLKVIPDLVVEVLSPSDSLKHVGQKIGEFLEFGVPIVWLVDPAERTVTVYRSLSDAEKYGGDTEITAEPLLPGFSCPVSRFF
jgi:Uma2 family endonuclease